MSLPVISAHTLQETFQAEYPFLDTSLLAALISELPPIDSTSDESLNTLRNTLKLLSQDAENAVSDLPCQISSPLESEELLESELSGSDAHGNASFNTPGTSISSIPSSLSNNPIATLCDFLQLLFPHLSSSLIEQVLQDEGSVDSADYISNEEAMYPIIDQLLNLEYIQDLTERGLGDASQAEVGIDSTYQPTNNKRKQTISRSRTKHIIPVVDIRQRQHVAHESKGIRSTSHDVGSRSHLANPWTRISSLATRASELLPSTPPGYFMTYFHKPKSDMPNSKAGWKGEADALREALLNLVAKAPSGSNTTELRCIADNLFSVALQTQLRADGALTSEQRSQVQQDVRLCLAATKGDSDAALNLVLFLCELEEAFEIGDGVAHVLPEAISPIKETPNSKKNGGVIRSVLRPPAAPPPLITGQPSETHSTRRKRRKDDGWTVVEAKRSSRKTHSHVAFIPAYSQHFPSRAPGKIDKATKNDPQRLAHALNSSKQEVGHLQSLRTQALREASRHWQQGNSKNYGGEVALFYAQRARELHEERRKWALDVARLAVEAKRIKTGEPNAIDLHGLTVPEAMVVVRETLEGIQPSSGLPFQIITGRGNHSVGQTSVLAPAIREMLIEEGYIVSQWDAGLIVRGKR